MDSTIIEVVDDLAARHDPWPEAVRIATAAPIEQVTARAIAIVDRLVLATSSLASVPMGTTRPRQ